MASIGMPRLDNNPLKFDDSTGRVPKWVEKWLREVRAMFGLPDPNNPLPPEGNPLPGTGDPSVGLTMGPNATTVLRPLRSSIIFVEMVELVWDFVSPGEVDTTAEFYDKIQEEGGYSKLGKRGRGRNARHIEGNEDYAEAFCWRLAGPKAREDTDARGGKILIGKDSAGNTISYRRVSRGHPNTPGYDGPPTVEIYENGKITKLKFIR